MDPSRRRATLVVAALGLAVFGALAASWAGHSTRPAGELPVYVRAASRLLHGEPIYRSDDAKPFTYPPFFAIPFLPLVGLRPPVQRFLWYLANLLAMAGSLWLLRDALRRANALPAAARPWWRAEPAFWGIVLLLAGRHLSSPFENQSHDLLILLACLLAVRALAFGAEIAGGAWAGVGAACKATPLLFAPVLLWQRRARAALAVGILAVALTLLPDLVFPKADGGWWWHDWISNFVGKIRPDAAAEAEGAWSSWNLLNQSLSGTLHRLFTRVEEGPNRFDVSGIDLPRSSLRWVILTANLGVLGLLLWSTRPALASRLPAEDLPRRRLLEGGAVVSAMLLLSPMSSKSHFCVLVLPIAACTAELISRRRDTVLLLLLGLVLAAGTLTTKAFLGREIGNQFLARGSVTLTALACLLACCRCLLRPAVERAKAKP